MFWAIHDRLVKRLFLDERPHKVVRMSRFETVAWVGHPTVLTIHTVWRLVGRHSVLIQHRAVILYFTSVLPSYTQTADRLGIDPVARMRVVPGASLPRTEPLCRQVHWQTQMTSNA